jgi:hypothetical protein
MVLAQALYFNPRIASPMPFPKEGSLLGPQITKAMTNTAINSSMPIQTR